MQNFHPYVVHIPLALLTLAAAAEIVHLLGRRPLPDTLSRWFLYLGTIGAAFAATSGWFAGESVAHVAGAEDHLVSHRNLGFVTLGLAVGLALWRWAAAAHGGPRPRVLFAAAMVALVALLFYTGQEGGHLVYHHGVGTALTAPGGPLAETDTARAEPRREVPGPKDFR
jgi:uncharacterized membrane protein